MIYKDLFKTIVLFNNIFFNSLENFKFEYFKKKDFLSFL